MRFKTWTQGHSQVSYTTNLSTVNGRYNDLIDTPPSILYVWLNHASSLLSSVFPPSLVLQVRFHDTRSLNPGSALVLQTLSNLHNIMFVGHLYVDYLAVDHKPRYHFKFPSVLLILFTLLQVDCPSRLRTTISA